MQKAKSSLPATLPSLPVREEGEIGVRASGSILKSFYAKNRIIDGTDDGFTVKIVT
ncbi:hypothetical protein ACFWFU_02980 [Streptomyces sp. NPDC060235]|uniref:hypothetical protein n=1 Tax=Streptomyces sp. NPDC060235 TaxID=3347080 RepID=UPI00364A2E2C